MSKEIIETVIITVFGVLLGNLLGDQLTFRDCATKGEAAMLGGGIVVCEIKKVKP